VEWLVAVGTVTLAGVILPEAVVTGWTLSEAGSGMAGVELV
jgi:hypothetical protein